MVSRRNAVHFDGYFLGAVLILLGMGIVIIYSSSGAYAQLKGLPDTFFLFNHVKKVIIALCLFGVGMMIDYKIWKRVAVPLLLLVMVLLIFLVTSSQVAGVNGAKRWITFASFGLQPTELAKIAIIFFLARFLAEKENLIGNLKKGLLPAIFWVGLVFGMVLLQPDYSSAAILLFVSVCMIFIGGAKFIHLLGLGLLAVPLLAYLVLSSPYRLQRMMAFLKPDENTASSYQSLQSLISLGNGGAMGTGLGTSTQKLGYLPMPFTDTIFSILGEELGFMGTSLCLFLFALLVWRGMKIAYLCGDRFGSLLAVGITMCISITVIMHVGVCAAFFPTTGQPLPFVSYGGTALCSMMFFSGVMLNISGHPVMENQTQKKARLDGVKSAWAKQRIRA